LSLGAGIVILLALAKGIGFALNKNMFVNFCESYGEALFKVHASSKARVTFSIDNSILIFDINAWNRLYSK